MRNNMSKVFGFLDTAEEVERFIQEKFPDEIDIKRCCTAPFYNINRI